jgi:hypothetical protein
VVVQLMSINVGNRPVVSVVSPEVMRSDTDRSRMLISQPAQSSRPASQVGGHPRPACSRSFGLFHASHPVRKFCKTVETASVTLDVVGSVSTTQPQHPPPTRRSAPTSVCLFSVGR